MVSIQSTGPIWKYHMANTIIHTTVRRAAATRVAATCATATRAAATRATVIHTYHWFSLVGHDDPTMRFY